MKTSANVLKRAHGVDIRLRRGSKMVWVNHMEMHESVKVRLLKIRDVRTGDGDWPFLVRYRRYDGGASHYWWAHIYPSYKSARAADRKTKSK